MQRSIRKPGRSRYESGVFQALSAALSRTMESGSIKMPSQHPGVRADLDLSAYASGCRFWAASVKSNPPRAGEQNWLSKYRWSLEMPIQVLLADDHQIVRDDMKLLLEREGYTVKSET